MPLAWQEDFPMVQQFPNHLVPEEWILAVNNLAIVDQDDLEEDHEDDVDNLEEDHEDEVDDLEPEAEEQEELEDEVLLELQNSFNAGDEEQTDAKILNEFLDKHFLKR